jgi:hypothetical protein
VTAEDAVKLEKTGINTRDPAEVSAGSRELTFAGGV